MSNLHPVDRNYDPGYPRALTQEEIEALLRPSIFKRFAGKTLAAGAVLTGVSIGGMMNGAPVPAVPPLPKPGLSTNKDAAFQEKIHRIARELLGDPKVAFWNPMSKINLQKDLKSNPPIKYPHIPISYGNSYVGIFDTEKAKRSTSELFTQWGIELKPDIAVKGEGYEFVPDGYNRDLKIGFKLILPEGQVGFGRPMVVPPEPAERKLDAKEVEALDKDIQAGKQRILVIKAIGFPNMDGDLYTPLEYYLASVIDYLNWIHGDRQIHENKVLGKVRESQQAGIRGETKVIEEEKDQPKE